MIGLDYKSTNLEGREKASLTENNLVKNLHYVYNEYSLGVVILSTCNRTEIYVSGQEDISDDLLLDIYKTTLKTDALYYIKRNEALVDYLFELSCGLHSMIFGEDQIITQVGGAISLAMEQKTSNAVLNTLFRHSVTCAKKAKTQVNARFISPSIVHKSIELAKKQIEDLSGYKVLVIGNGEMGRLCSNLLEKEGCKVYMTKRSYKYSNAIIPQNCIAVDYATREKLYSEVDMIFSATKSPHHTVTFDSFANVKTKPKCIFDLAVPRDVEPSVEKYSEINLFDVDDIGKDASPYDIGAIKQINDIISEQKVKLAQWHEFYQNHVQEKITV